jgi:hypothetical protein
MAVSDKFKVYDFVARGEIPLSVARAVPLSVAIAMALHQHPERPGYSALPAPEPTDMPEDGFAGGLPIRQGSGVLGTHTLGNGTGTFVNGTNTHYFWPVPQR